MTLTQPHIVDAPPFDPTATPDTVTLRADRGSLHLSWSEGADIEIPAAQLRSACRCAWCTRARLDGSFATTFDGVAIEGLTPIGGYAVNIAFTDGHARGIFPWIYLRGLAAPRPAADEHQHGTIA